LKEFIVIIILSALTIYAQEKTISRSEFKSELIKLEAQKSNLLIEIELLRKDIISYNEKVSELDKSIIDCNESSVITKLDKLTKKYGKDIASMISSGKIWKGMTIEMLRDSWGEPDKVNEDTFSYGTFAQLKYGDIEFFFRDKKLIDWEEKK
jgi:hypothetical protein